MIRNPFKKAGVEHASDPGHPSTATQGKGKPTRKRRDAQRQRLRPLVPIDRKASIKAARTRMRQRENAEYEAMRTGDTAHMPKAERLPWRIYIRDHVDARFNLGEFFIPVALVMLVCIVALGSIPGVMFGAVIALYTYLIAAIIDVSVMWRRLRRRLVERYGEQSVARGSRSGSYAWSRAIQIRRFRLPKPRYAKRGHWPD